MYVSMLRCIIIKHVLLFITLCSRNMATLFDFVKDIA